MPQFLDTSILLYSISRNSGEQEKRERAIELLGDDSSALSVQVLQEFYVQATRPSRSDAIPHDLAVGLIESWMRFRIQSMNLEVLRSALHIRRTRGFSFWDSAVIAAALALRCGRLLSEDLSDGQVIDGMTIENPFRDV